MPSVLTQWISAVMAVNVATTNAVLFRHPLMRAGHAMDSSTDQSVIGRCGFGDDRDGGTASGAINCEGVKTLDACKPVLTSAAMSV